METSTSVNLSSTQKSLGAAAHLSVLTQYFIPFGNFVLPVIIWSAARESEFIERQGKSVINFQLSVLLYTIVMGLIAVPVALSTLFSHVPLGDFHFEHVNVSTLINHESMAAVSTLLVLAFLFCLLKVAEFFLAILGASRAARGESFRYPLSIRFIR